jgi:drug/metabolite transporter (DMT)-like permease
MAAARTDVVRSALVANLGLLLMVVVWGAMFPAIERILVSWDVLSATAGRHTVALLGLLLVMSIRERQLPVRRDMPWGKLLLLGFFGVSLTSLMMTLSIELSSGVSAAIASATNPISSAITARLLHRVPLLPGIVLGAVLSTAGALVSIFGSAGAAVELRGGEVLVIGANVIWTWYSMMAQRWLAGHSQLQITGLTALTGVAGLYAVLGIVGASGLAEFHLELSPEPLLLVVVAGASVAIGNSLWHYGVSRVGVTLAAMYGNLIPVVAAAIAFWAGTPPTAAQLIGAAVIIAGVLYAQVMALRRDRDT